MDLGQNILGQLENWEKPYQAPVLAGFEFPHPPQWVSKLCWDFWFAGSPGPLRVEGLEMQQPPPAGDSRCQPSPARSAEHSSQVSV